ARLSLRPAERGIATGRRDLDALSRRLTARGKEQLAAQRARLDALERMRLSLGYEATLQRGYAVVRKGEAVVTRAAEAQGAPLLEIQFADGRVTVGTKAARRKPPPAPPEQGELL
ncbi:exodeoxyribonuclease VII large subunit, partial [Oceaniglobus roseus]|uniref:exodeoxyribonuclease VII large subunit n=1 Tax=Oceaniglobus roseus TaxID=1737570 RepID=UPI00248205A1